MERDKDFPNTPSAPQRTNKPRDFPPFHHSQTKNKNGGTRPRKKKKTEKNGWCRERKKHFPNPPAARQRTKKQGDCRASHECQTKGKPDSGCGQPQRRKRSGEKNRHKAIGHRAG